MVKDFSQKQKGVFWVIAGTFLIAATFFTYVLVHNQYLRLGSGKNQGCGMVYDKPDNVVVKDGARVGYPIVNGQQTAPDFKFNGQPYNVMYCSDGLVARGSFLYYYRASDSAIADCLAGRSGPLPDLQEASSGECDNIRHLHDTVYIGEATNSTRLGTELLLYWVVPAAVLLIIWKRYIVS